MVRLLLISVFLAPVFSTVAQDAIRMTPLPKSVEESASGPWGVLEYYKIRLSCPPQYLSLIPIPSEKTEWIFPYETDAELKESLLAWGITSQEISFLLKNRDIIFSEESMRVFPSSEVITEMPAELRSKFYQFLARFSQNSFHRRPAFLNTANVSRYFRDSNFSVATLQKIALLAYPTPSGHGFFLSDIPYLLKEAGSSEDERQLLNALLRVPALMVRLNLSEDKSAEELAAYWTNGFRNKQIRPLFESVIMNPHIHRLDIGHLLPPMARRNLNSFPDMSEGLDGRYPDWFWTCYNFFRFTPVDVYANSEIFSGLIETEFTKSEAPYEFGDMLLLKSENETVHGCIYVADDIVYTKNGAGLFSPTILMKLEDVVSFHDLEGDIRLEIYRKTTRERKTSVYTSTTAKSQ